MKRKLGRDLSFNALQLVLNQVTGLVIFYILSTSLDKTAFGGLNLALAVLLAAFNILSLGIDQLMIKKIAAGAAVGAAVSIYICHVLLSGLSFYGLLWLCGIFVPTAGTYDLILLIGIGKLMIFFSAPFKQVANGMEKFKLLAWMSVVSNGIRSICLLLFALLKLLSVKAIILIFIGGDLAELLVSIILYRQYVKIPVVIKWSKTAYIKLLREALPQAGVVVITSALARFDWIFIGLIVSAVKLAEYSFAYKVFEMATFPLLAIAPVLIPLFTKIFQQADIDGAKLRFLLRMELIVAALVALLLNICWSPVVDMVTTGKYGMVNEKTILILSMGMPLLYVNNFLWTVNFAQGRLGMIFRSFIVALLVNVAGDLLLIPFYQNEGAAVAFILSVLAQTIFYMKMNTVPQLHRLWRPLCACTVCALLSGFLTNSLFTGLSMAVPSAVVLYVLFLGLSAQLKPADFRNLRKI